MSRIAFHRPVRLLPPTLENRQIVLPAPPEDTAQAGANGTLWLTLLLPLMSSVSMASYMIIYHNLLLIIIGVAFVVFSVGVTVFVRHQMRTSAKKDKSRQRGRYLRFLADVKLTARTVAGTQRLVAAWVHPSPARLWAIARRRRRVWERRPGDEDFLRVRLGLGHGPLASAIQLGGKGDPLAEYDEKIYGEASRLVARFGTVGRQPALLDLAGAGVVSLLGPADRVRAVARAMVCQVGVLHAPDDVGVIVRTAGDPGWDWAKWLPHAHEPDAVGVAGVVPMVAAELADLADVLDAALRGAQEGMIARERALTQARRAEPTRRLVVVLDSYDPRSEWARDPALTTMLAQAGPALGVTVVCLVGDERDEPSRSQVRVRIDADGSLCFESRRRELFSDVTDAVADQPESRLCELTVRALAPLRLTNEPDRVLTQVAPLLDMLGAADLAAFEPSKAWRAADDERMLRVPIGVAGDGETVELDLKESAQDGMGPHGLVVGATGSGKSELLRTLVTGLTMTHSPELLSLVLVDFKGGATFAGLTELPHVAGLITNLADDLSLVDRVRDALHGEQQRRQKMLRDAGNVDSLREYQMRQAAGYLDVHGHALEPLPYLLIIVDEFGELLSQRSDFIDLFVQIGRVGRSLGMHLLLATQRLDEGRLRGLESHLSYRICLRTFSAAESRAVIGTPDAYQLPPVPGSAYLKVDESVYRRFRVAHVSGPYESPAEAAERAAVPMSVVPFGPRTAPTADQEPAPAQAVQSTVGRPTAMHVAVGRLCEYGQSVHQVWLPPLPAVVPLDALLGPISADPERGWQAALWPGRGALRVPVGLIDLPTQQEQRPLVLDFTQRHGNIAIVGAPQTGKSTLLRSLVLGLLLTNTPDEAQVYCVDFGGGGLYPFAGAPHVGAVAGRRDTERARRVLAELQRVVVAREHLFGELGIDSVAGFRGLRRAGRLAPDVNAAEIFCVIDNWGAVRTELPDAEEALIQIAARGLGVGVHVVLSTPRWADIRMALRDSVGTRLELRLNDPAESEVSRAVAKQLTEAPPGRGITAPGVIYHAVAPRLDSRETMDLLAESLEESLAKLRAGWTGAVAPPVRLLPEQVLVSELSDVDEPGVPIGLGDHTLEPVHLELAAADPHFLVFGDAGAGKSTFLRTWMGALARRYSAREVRCMVVDYRRSLLDVLPDEYVGAYASDGGAAQAYAEKLVAKLAERMPPPGISARALRERDWWTGPEFYLVVDDYDLVAGSRQSPLAQFVDLVAQAPEIGLHIVLTRRASGASRAAMSDPLLTRIRELGAGGLLLSGDAREGVLLGDERPGPLPAGRGLLVRRQAKPMLVQVAVDEAHDRV